MIELNKKLQVINANMVEMREGPDRFVKYDYNRSIKDLVPEMDKETKKRIDKMRAEIAANTDRERESELIKLEIEYEDRLEKAKNHFDEILKMNEWYRSELTNINKKYDDKDAKEKRTALDLYLDMYSTHLREIGDIAGADLEELKNKYQKLRTTIETDPFLNKNPIDKKRFKELLSSNEIKETETITKKFTLLFQEMWNTIKKQAEEAKRSIEDLVYTLKELKNQLATTIENKPIVLDLLGTNKLEKIQGMRDLSLQYQKETTDLNRKIKDITQQGIDDRLKLEEDYNNRATTGLTEKMYNERLALINKKENEESKIIKDQLAIRKQLYDAQAESILSKEMKDYLTSSIEYLSDTFADAFAEMSNGTKSVGKAFKDMATSIARDLQKLLFKQAFLMIFQTIANAYTGSSGIGSNYSGAGANTSGQGYTATPRERGGSVYAGGAYLIGEKGPELLQMGNRGGTITPNNKLKTNNNNFNISINVDGSKGGTTEQNDRMAKQIAREVKQQVQTIIQDEKRYGGSLGRQSMRTI